jgi:hypothetical protein
MSMEPRRSAVTWIAESYPLLCTLAFVGVSLVVSARLLMLARRTRCLPELLLGLGLLGTAVLGYGVLIASALLRGPTSLTASTTLERALQALGQCLHDAGVTMVVLFVLTVFRPRDTWARVLAALILVALWGGHLGWELTNGFRHAGRGNGFWWLRYAVIWSYPIWTLVESYRYYALMRRRIAVGLGDPLVTNRFFLWGTASLGTALATWISSASFFLDAQRLAVWSPTIQVATATAGVITVGLYYLTFLPPARYQRWLAGGALTAH